MKKSKFSESQIIKILKEIEHGRGVPKVTRELGIHKSTFYYWHKKRFDLNNFFIHPVIYPHLLISQPIPEDYELK